MSSTHQIDRHGSDEEERATQHALRLCATLLDSDASAWLETALENVALMAEDGDRWRSLRASTQAETLICLAARMSYHVNRIRKCAKTAFLAESSGQHVRPACANKALTNTLRDLANYALIAQVEAGRSA